MAEVKITQKNNNSTEIAISGELTIYCAMDVFQQYFQQITLKKLTLLKLGNITEIDTAGIQLLIMLMKIVSEQNSQYQIISLGEAITHYSNLFQLNCYFVDFEEIVAKPSNKKEEE
jgi:ABC-type transporter Mla MlaB component